MSGASNSLPGLVFFGTTLRSLCQNIQARVTPTLKSCLDSNKGLPVKAVPPRFR